MKKADNAKPFYLEIDLKIYHAAFQKNSVLNNMSNVDHLYVYNLWYFSSLIPVQSLQPILIFTKTSYGRSKYKKGKN